MICQGCGAAFTPSRRDQRYCARKCANHGLRTQSRKDHVLEFIGIDGEGISSPQGHDYVLLSATGFPSLHRNGQRLTTLEIFDWLYNTVFRAKPNAVYVGYFLGYDWSQILRDLSEQAARLLITDQGVKSRQRRGGKGRPPWPVRWQGWEIDGLGLRRIKLRPEPQSPRDKVPWMYICDAGAFFQTSFVRAIDPAPYQQCGEEPPVTAEQYRMIVEGKARRGVETFGKDMIRYNAAELEALPKILEPLNRAFRRMGVRLQRNEWFGPGQAAQKWLSAIHCPTGEVIRASVPEGFREAARRSYYGGWFEIFWHGPYPGVLWEYDINSAYPAVMAALPCLLHGAYSSGTASPPNVGPRDLVLVYARVSGSHARIGSMLHRRHDGQIIRPWDTEGWYWQHELLAAHRAGLIDRIESKEWQVYRACDCPPPIAAIADLYRQRVELGEDMKNSPFGTALKIVYNSCYGKFAQSVGNPKFANPIYASLITAGCRTRILEAIGSHPEGAEAVAMVATDGVYFTFRHPGLLLDKTVLGAWSETERHGMTLFKPGVYWDNKTRAALQSGEAKLKSRGINGTALARHIDEIDRQWAAMAEGNSQDWPALDIPIPFSLISPRLALARGDWSLCGQVITDGVIRQSSDPRVKRRPLQCGPGWSMPHRCEYYRGEAKIQSSPYDGLFGEDEDVTMALGVHPEGDIIAGLASLLRGEG
jgi:hypothetical protein